MKVLITGSRTWNNEALMFEVFRAFDLNTIFIHGGASGADGLAGRLLRERGIVPRVYPADWQTYGTAAGPLRNIQMLDTEHPNLVLSFRMPGRSPGTDHMVREARKRGIRVIEWGAKTT